LIQNSLAVIGGLAFGLLIGHGFRWLRDRYVVTRRSSEAVADPVQLPPETQDALKAQNLIVAEWHKWNPWYCDPILALEAQIVHLQLQNTNPGQPLAENLAEVTAEMRRRYPEIMTIN
jgi:hypothetical protein